MTRIATLAALACALAACPPSQPPAPVPPDAADAAPTPGQEASAPPAPATPCQAACDAMAAICGPQPANCVAVMSEEDGAKILREPGSGRPLVCSDIAAATNKAAMRAIGLVCP